MSNLKVKTFAHDVNEVLIIIYEDINEPVRNLYNFSTIVGLEIITLTVKGPESKKYPDLFVTAPEIPDAYIKCSSFIEHTTDRVKVLIDSLHIVKTRHSGCYTNNNDVKRQIREYIVDAIELELFNFV